jgi:hypothetical protein
MYFFGQQEGPASQIQQGLSYLVTFSLDRSIRIRVSCLGSLSFLEDLAAGARAGQSSERIRDL